MKLRIPVLLALVACGGTAARPPGRVIISVVGTSDLHGHLMAEGDLGGVALLAAYVANVRAARAADGGGVVLVDGGDAFQGTLESNLAEGEAVVSVMNHLGYHAMAIGNHDFDYGPVGPATSPRAPGDDPRGALKARAAQAHYPFLTSNVYEGGKPLAAPNIMPSTIVGVAGVQVGIVGAATEDTPTSTSAPTWKGLELRPLAPSIAAEASSLRKRGAQIVVLVAHAGLCRRTIDNEEIAHCQEGEIADVVRALPPGAVDVVVGGHTHMGVATEIAGVPIVEGWKYDRGFGRVDLTLENGRIVGKKLYEPHLLCARVAPGTERCDKGAPAGERVAASYEGRPIVPDGAVAAIITPYCERARSRREDKLGVHVASTVIKAYDEESPYGNLVADLMRAARPAADVAITNGGGLRTDLPAGDLSYGQVYEAYPFDNRFAEIRLSGRSLRSVIAANLERPKGILSISGVRAKAVCKGGALDVTLLRDDGRPVGDDERLRIATSDFLAGSGMEGSLGGVKDVEIDIEEGTLVREELISILRKRGGVLAGDDPTLFDPTHRRLDYPGPRPVTCTVR